MQSSSPNPGSTGGSQDGPAKETQGVGLSGDLSVAGQPISVSDLFRELQETNRLLRAIASQKAVGEPTPQLPTPLVAVSCPLSPDQTGGDICSPTPDLEMARENARQLVEELAHVAFGSGPRNTKHLEQFRDNTISLISRAPASPRGRDGKGCREIKPRNQVRLVYGLADSPDAKGRPPGQPSELLWNWRTSPANRKLPLADQVVRLRRQWPVHFDLDRVTQSISRDSGWILGKNSRRDGVICAAPLIYTPGRKAVPAHAILDASHKDTPIAARTLASNLASPGSLWHFTTPVWANRVLPLSSLALIAAVCFLNPEDDMDTVRDYLHEFCAAWKPLSLRGRNREFSGWTGNSETSYQHTIRCFSNVVTTDESDFVPYIRCHREGGQFPSLPGAPISTFAERRMSVLFRWSHVDSAPYFTIVLLGDFQSIRLEARESNDLFTDWEDRRFIVKGENAGYHLLQAAVHRILTFWEREWSHCLDALDNAVNTKLDDILSDEASNSLMFDSSFARSRAYFKTLEILRIFGDIIRETGRDLQEMDPERLLQGSFRRAGWDVRYFLRDDPVTDKALWENWRILSEFQVGAEGRLLRRITEKTEEIKSLRDGLFNATSLREAARSTTMNRYVIVFTVVTVLYIPPSFTASLFGTPLFEAEEQADTVERFRISTIVFCVITYVLSFLLIWVADKGDTAGTLYRQARALWWSPWGRVGGQGVVDSDSNEKLHMASDDTSRRMSV
ncbi:hypothetical protein C8A00DRAFT_17399 [Chaetomidium leptoderma]|uniref:Uncharacterized protein n=1 Tax=Chaetomidium leptoderma TaxID=669021 RepID=A0AAN6VGM7_9PEZI|nr:hypothetical protein C8A00DRAFT_17399 [Chaetomidium leptoderma]